MWSALRPPLAQLSNLAYAVNATDEALFGGPTLAEIWDKGVTSAREDPTCVREHMLRARSRARCDCLHTIASCTGLPVPYCLPYAILTPCSRELAQALWGRARSAGAWSELDRRRYGMADDVAAAGWLLLELVFGALATPPGAVDAATLRRLVGTTFMGDIEGFREFAAAEDGWVPAAALLEADRGAGWDLVSRMLAADWRERPRAARCLQHPFLAATR